MTIENLRNQLPDYAKDIRLNLSSLANETLLNTQQKYGSFMAAAFASRNATVIKEINAEIADKLSPDAQNAVKSAAAIMGMNNVYYRFVHLSSNSLYATLPAKLRMNVIANPGIDKIDFELWSLAVSAVNGCGMCIDAHEKVVREAGLSTEQIQTTIRIASVINAVAQILDGEVALRG